MEIRSLGFRTDIALLTRSGSEVEDRGAYLVVRTSANPTYFWGNFILLAEAPVPGGEREVVAVFRNEFPDATHVSIGIDEPAPAPSDASEEPGDDGGLQAWRDAGLTPDVSSVLVAERLVQPLATIAAVEVRALESDDDWEQRARLSHTLYPATSEAVFMPFARARNGQERSMVAVGQGVRYGAFADGELVSTAGVFLAGDGLARFQTVETHPDHRRQGLAATLVHRAGRAALESLGAQRLVIVADTEGEAIRVYRRLGFADVERHVEVEGRSEEWAEA